jgi:hypothetical protein
VSGFDCYSHLSYLTLSGDTIWDRNLSLDLEEYQCPEFTSLHASSDNVYISGCAVGDALFYGWNVSGNLVWTQKSVNKACGGNISRSDDGFVTATCTSGVFIEEKYRYTRLLKYHSSPNVVSADAPLINKTIISWSQSSDCISVRCHNEYNVPMQLVLADIAGHQIFDGPMIKQGTIDKANLKPGIYILRIIADGTVLTTQKVMIPY